MHGRTGACETSEFCDGCFENCDGNSVTILKVVAFCDGPVTIRHKLRSSVTDCDGSITILAPFLFFVFGAVQLSLDRDERSPDPRFHDNTLLLSTYPGDPTHPTTLLCTPSPQPTTGEDSHFGLRSRACEQYCSSGENRAARVQRYKRRIERQWVKRSAIWGRRSVGE